MLSSIGPTTILSSIRFLNFFPTIIFVSTLIHFATPDQLSPQGPLVFAQILHRHGDRSPTKPWGPNDPNQEEVWPQGWGQLSQEGMRQLHFLGQTLKKRYKDLISDDYVNSEIYVYSSGVERALMSVQANLAGLYPPTGKPVWMKGLPWQPIPIHSSPVNTDWVMRSSKVCKATLSKLIDDYIRTSPEVETFFKTHKELIVNATKAAGLYTPNDDISNLKSAWRLGGNLHIVRTNNKTLLPWMTDQIIDGLYNLRVMKKSIESQASLAIRRLQGGPLVGKLLSNFQDFTRGTLNPEDHTGSGNKTIKMMLYSGHDTNIAAILGTLDLYTPPFWPGYGSAVLLELYHMGVDRFCVKFYFLDGIVKYQPHLRQLMLPLNEDSSSSDTGNSNLTSCYELKELVNTYKHIAVWSREELDSLGCVQNGGISVQNGSILLIIITICLSTLDASLS